MGRHDHTACRMGHHDVDIGATLCVHGGAGGFIGWGASLAASSSAGRRGLKGVGGVGEREEES